MDNNIDLDKLADPNLESNTNNIELDFNIRTI